MPVANRQHSFWALLFGVLAMVFTFIYLTTTRAADRRRADVELTAASQRVDVLIAKRDLPRGTRIEPDDLQWVKAVRAHLPKQLVINETKVVGRETIADIFAGEPIVGRRISGAKASRGSMMIRRGRVALAVGVDEVAGVAGGIRPGDRVDVMVSEEESGQTKPLFEFVRVLGVAGQYPFLPNTESEDDEFAPSAGTGSAGTAVVLELRPKEAAAVTEASENGSIRLALRAPE